MKQENWTLASFLKIEAQYLNFSFNVTHSLLERNMKAWVLSCLIWALFLLNTCPAASDAVQNDLIIQENKKAGASDWWYDADGREADGPVGFSTQFSVRPGDTLHFKLATVFKSLQVRVLRLGYYGGRGARQIDSFSLHSDTGHSQPECHFDPTWRLVDCSNWRVTFTWTVPEDSVSGVFVAVTSTRYINGTMLHGNYMPFVVRQPPKAPGTALLFKTSEYTWAAYNKFGRWNLYRGNGTFTFESRAKKVSLNRPFTNRLPKMQGGQHQNFLFGTEFPMLFWLEQHGYDVSYASCHDVEQLYESRQLATRGYQVLLSVGHDEYYTSKLRKAYEFAREKGIHLAFLSGNELFWQVRTEHFRTSGSSTENALVRPVASNPEGRAEEPRIIVCHKETIDGGFPVKRSDSSRRDARRFNPFEHNKRYHEHEEEAELQWTGTYVDSRHRAANPQNSLSGQLFMVNGFRSDAMRVPPEFNRLRLWRSTTFFNTSRTHETFQGLLGYEIDMYSEDCYRPHGLITLSSTTLNVTGMLMEDFGASYKGSGVVTHKLSLYRYSPLVPRGRNIPVKTALVFGAGTIQWAWALSSFHDGDRPKADRDLQQATMNMFADMGVLPASLVFDATFPPLVMPRPSSDTKPPRSSISSPASGSAVALPYSEDASVMIEGSAEDFSQDGDGQVALVEISFDGGVSWHVAEGRERWRFRLSLFRAPSCSGSKPTSFVYQADSKQAKKSEFLIVMSRAVDDSGWMEETSMKKARRTSSNSHTTQNVISFQVIFS